MEGVTFVFNQSQLEDALLKWQETEIKRYPHRKDLITMTVFSMGYFFKSEVVRDSKMTMGDVPDDFFLGSMPKKIDVDKILKNINKDK